MDIGKILKIAAFAACILAGIFLVYSAFTNQRYSLLAWAVVAFFGGITGFKYGVSGHPTGGIDPRMGGGKFLGLPDWVILADGALIVVALVLSWII